MGLFGIGKAKEAARLQYDKSGKKPVIRASICTGEQVAGFRDEQTGKVEELMLIRDKKDLDTFCQLYQVKQEEIEKIW